MNIEQVNNFVVVGNTFVPAVNIQVEGMPGFINGDWYDIYFEVIFEDGVLWIVSQGNGKLSIEEYSKLSTYHMPPSVTYDLDNWEEFLVMYDDRRKEVA